MNNKIPSELDREIARHNENAAYSNGLIKGEEANGHVFTEEEIKNIRKINQEFIANLNLIKGTKNAK